ncbi:general stress protein [Sphaerisporangium rhizosphaerae]|uniref:General stress protein n=1 Tax=Sphaerisporangium rhizosphaerae TaxID=2269375 RepID=A0ABW2P9P7_9ACTN
MIGSSPELAAPSAIDRRLLVSYDNYPAAQRAVDTLSDAGYPVQNVAIVGNDLRLEELVTGRLTNPRAALSGAISGAVFGLVVGLFLGLFTTTTASFFALVVWAILWGAVMGAAFGFAGHAFKGGTRDFTSRSAIVAGRYDVLVPAAAMEEALAVLEGGNKPADTVVVARPPSSGPLRTPGASGPETTAPSRPETTGTSRPERTGTSSPETTPGATGTAPPTSDPFIPTTGTILPIPETVSPASPTAPPASEVAPSASETSIPSTGTILPTSGTVPPASSDVNVPAGDPVTGEPAVEFPAQRPAPAPEPVLQVEDEAGHAGSPDPAHADPSHADPTSADVISSDTTSSGTAESAIVPPATSRAEAMEEATIAIPLSAVPRTSASGPSTPASEPSSPKETDTTPTASENAGLDAEPADQAPARKAEEKPSDVRAR